MIPANNYGSAYADFIQTTAAAINPQWTWTTSRPAAANIAVYYEDTDPPTDRPRISQAYAELGYEGTGASRISQGYMEIGYADPTEARTSQVYFEVGYIGGSAAVEKKQVWMGNGGGGVWID